MKPKKTIDIPYRKRDGLAGVFQSPLGEIEILTQSHRWFGKKPDGSEKLLPIDTPEQRECGLAFHTIGLVELRLVADDLPKDYREKYYYLSDLVLDCQEFRDALNYGVYNLYVRSVNHTRILRVGVIHKFGRGEEIPYAEYMGDRTGDDPETDQKYLEIRSI